MTPETLKALKGSIDKWEKIVDCEGVDLGSDNCELCYIFNIREDTEDDCKGCPVFKKTADRHCDGTPHEKWLNYSSLVAGAVFDQKSYNLALKELEFLKSLLPSEESK